MNICQRPPYQKADKLPPDPVHIGRVKGLPCICCGSPAPNEAHHCRDLPDFDEQGLYKQLPGMGRKSHDHDAIPLCPPCHRLFHGNRPQFHELAGKDYGHIGPTRALIAAQQGEIQF